MEPVRQPDALRAVVERTRSDLTLTLVQARLHAALGAQYLPLGGAARAQGPEGEA